MVVPAQASVGADKELKILHMTIWFLLEYVEFSIWRFDC